jgi:hypothetical protein
MSAEHCRSRAIPDANETNVRGGCRMQVPQSIPDANHVIESLRGRRNSTIDGQAK